MIGCGASRKARAPSPLQSPLSRSSWSSTVRTTAVPMVQAREEYLLADLSEAERKVLDAAFEKVGERARQLIRHG